MNSKGRVVPASVIKCILRSTSYSKSICGLSKAGYFFEEFHASYRYGLWSVLYKFMVNVAVLNAFSTGFICAIFLQFTKTGIGHHLIKRKAAFLRGPTVFFHADLKVGCSRWPCCVLFMQILSG